MKRLLILVVSPAVVPMALAAASPPVPPSPSVDATRTEFMALCAAQRRSDDAFFGERIVGELEAQLASPRHGLVARAKLRGQLGSQLLRLGRTPEAIESFDAGIAALRDLAPQKRLRLQLERDLALAHLLEAEKQNCVARHARTSCILPIAPDAVHVDVSHTRRAAELYETYLGEYPTDPQVRWLLNIARMVAGDGAGGVPERWRLPAGALRAEAELRRFPNISAELGVDSFDLAGGAAMDDFDGDGLLDLVSSTWDPCDHMKAFRNDGRGGFEDVTARWGLDAQFGGLNLVHADYDNDGRLDLLVLRGAWQGALGEIRNSLLRNEIGKGADRFVDVTAAAGLGDAYPTQTAAWADYDGDGDLDLYVGNEADGDRPYPSQLFRNEGAAANGSVTFRDVTEAAGVANRRYAKAVVWGDYDDDGDPDLYVSNIGANRLYLNQGAGADGVVVFRDVAAQAGVAAPRHASFTSWFFDYDNDGDLDLLVADYQSEFLRVSASYLGLAASSGHPVLYRNEGRGGEGRVTFTDVSAELGLVRPLLPMGSNYGDLDNDGYLDIYFGTGVPDLEAVMPNVMYKNDAGRRFLDVSASGGFGHLQKGHGVAFGDLDNDGDQDLFQELGGAYPVDAYFNALYENPGHGSEPGRGWITLRLEGRRANRFGVGARIEVRLRRGEERRSVHVLAGSGGSFGASSLQQEIGLGDAESIEALVVRWPGSGTVQRFDEVAMRRVYRLVEGDEMIPVELPVLELGKNSGHRGRAMHK